MLKPHVCFSWSAKAARLLRSVLLLVVPLCTTVAFIACGDKGPHSNGTPRLDGSAVECNDSSRQ